MCSHQEWERFTSQFRETLDDTRVREFVADVADRIEAFVEEFASCGCAPENAEWVRGRARRSRTDWVA